MELRKYFLVIFQLMLLGAALTEGLQCYNCSSNENFRCLSSPESLDREIYSCSGGICIEETKDGVHRKGCSDTIPQPGILICNNYDYCNSNSFEFDCLLCNSSQNLDCKSNVSSVTTTCRSKMCFSSMDTAGSIIRGCQNCSDSNSCSSCNNAENCNNETFHLCYRCKGDDCLSPGTNTSTCLSNNQCFTKLHSDGSIERGCNIGTDSSSCTGDDCESCLGDYCNSGILPKDRLKCFQCNETMTCEENYCPKLVDNDECFAYSPSLNQMVRGCLSDDIEKKCNASNCETCNSPSCNSWKFNERPSKLKCYQCSDCKTVENLEAGSCQPYPFNKEEKCFTHSDNATQSVKRGCYYDIGDIDDKCDGEACKICNQDNCNHDIVLSCYNCTDCLTSTNSTSLSLCNPGEFCVSRISGDGEVIRGCSSKNCSIEGNSCSTCDSDKCNHGIFPSDRLSCLQCNSSTTEDECSKGLVPMTSCSKYQKDDKCYQFVNETLIRRGCSSDIETAKCSLESHCLECSINGCNNISLKLNSSLSCVQCENCNNKLIPKEEQCSYKYYYFEVEECFTQNVTSNNGETTTNKGCLLSLPTRNCGEDCSVCRADGCNKHGSDYKEYPDFKCYICHGKDCEGEVEKCDPIPSTENGGEGCYVERREDLVIRDCISNAGKWNSSLRGTNVITCKTDSCNCIPAPNSAMTAHLSNVFLIVVALFFSSEMM